MPIQISRNQAKFLQSKARTVIFRAGIRSGKTWVLCYKAIEKALQKRRFCIVSFSYPMLRDVCMYTMEQILTKQAPFPHKFYTTDKICVVNKTEILFRSGDDPDSLRGLSLDDFGIDEARQFKNRNVYDIMIGRISNSPDGQAFIATTSKGRNWVFHLENKPHTEVIIQKTLENPFLPEAYVQGLKEIYTSQFARQELNADIVEFGAGVINPGWFIKVPTRKPEGNAVRFWDVAVSIKKSADFSAGALCSLDKKFTIHDIRHGKYEYPDLRRLIIATAQSDGIDTTIAVEEAGQQRGFIDDLKIIPELSEYTIQAIRPEGDKFNRSMPWVSRAELGSVEVCDGAWNESFFDECASFTADDSHEHDDQIDAVSGAWQALNKKLPLIIV